MSETTAFNMRIDAQLKQKAEELFNDLGLSMSDAVRLFFSQSVKEQAIPFRAHIPNAETRRALQSKYSSRPYSSAEEMFKDMGIDVHDKKRK